MRKRDDDVWAPPFRIVFMALLSVRILSAAALIIPDCDEVYNYLEPLHHLARGGGGQQVRFIYVTFFFFFFFFVKKSLQEKECYLLIKVIRFD